MNISPGMRSTTTAVLVVVICLTASTAAASGWPHDPKTNLPVSVDPVSSPSYAVIASGGEGSAILLWVDETTYEVRAQKIDAMGNLLWDPAGVLICGVEGHKYTRQVLPCEGGAIFMWDDQRSVGNQDIYVQRVDWTGSEMWDHDGVAVCVHDSAQFSAWMAPDGWGGAVVVFGDARFGTDDTDIYVQHVNASGVRQWGDVGSSICAAYGNQRSPRVVQTTDGEYVCVWEDERWETIRDIYAQKFDLTSAEKWTPNGEAIANQSSVSEIWPAIAADGDNGAIITWTDYRSGESDIYAQRMSTNGSKLWGSSGLGVCTYTDYQNWSEIVPDGNDGVIIAWEDMRAGGSEVDIYAQRINAGGIVQWTAEGVAVTTAPKTQSTISMVPDGMGGAVIAWDDQRNLVDFDVYAQRVSAYGFTQWETDGVAVSTAPYAQFGVQVCSDNKGGAIMTWFDNRGDLTRDLFAQRVEQWGYLGYPSADIVSVLDEPNDQGSSVIVSWTASYLDLFPYVGMITQYSTWRHFLGAFAEDGAYIERAIDRAVTAGFDRGFAAEMAAQGWEWLSNTPAAQLPTYACTAPTFGDSTGTGIPWCAFMVIAHAYDGVMKWDSEVAYGYSVDNLPPYAPANLAAELSEQGVLLTWDAPVPLAADFSHYAVYRDAEDGFVPEPDKRVGTASNLAYTDAVPNPNIYYYLVTTVDVHENESGPTNQASVDMVTGAGDGPSAPPKIVTVLQNHPNPFEETTEITIGLPRTADVTVEVYDVAGRRVFGDELHALKEGWTRYLFAGRDSGGNRLPSGIYFSRVRALGKTTNHKMVITR